MKKQTVISVFMLVLITLACSLPTPNKPTGQGAEETPQKSSPLIPLLIGTPQAKPVSISEGLASLNSYTTKLSINSTGPDPKNSSSMTFDTQRSKEKDAQVTNITSIAVKDGKPSPDNSNSVIYRIGDDQCSGSGEEWSYSSMAPSEAETMDMVMSMFSFTPAIDNPVFVAAEKVNGVATNHFSFKVKGLGSKSGANVTMNKGDYWLATDGQYIVKYSLSTETVVDPKTNVSHLEILFEVKDINQPVNVVLPQGCLDAAKVTPSPAP